MKILFIQKMPDIRNWKMAQVLSKEGHEVYLGQVDDSLTDFWRVPLDCYKEVFTLTSIVGLSFIAPYFDIIHVHNKPDWWTCAAVAMTKGSKTKVIHDCHEWILATHEDDLDILVNSIVANTLPALAIYVSEEQQKAVESITGEHQANYAIIKNYPLKEFIPQEDELLPKIESKKTSLVYAGLLSVKPESARFLYNEFMDLLKRGYELHIYSQSIPEPYRKLERSFQDCHINGKGDYTQLMVELSQYDIGLLPFQINPLNQTYAETLLPEELFLYVGAGIPVACRKGLLEQQRLIEDYHIGFSYGSFDEFKAGVAKKDKFKLNRFKWTIDEEIKKTLIPNYMAISPNYEYKEIMPREMLTFKEYAVELEIFEGHGVEIGLYGRSHSMDLVFESFMAEERKITNEQETEDSEAWGGEGIAEESGADLDS